MAVAAHDTDAVLSMVDPNIKLGFGGDDGLRMLRGHLSGADAPEYWRSLGRILALGGAFKSASAFEAPYVFSNWPEGADAFECGAVTGANVAVRKEGRPDAALVTRTSYALVRLGGETSARKGWAMVQLPTGQKGYVHTDFLWGATALRAVFNLTGGQWRMTGLVSGDWVACQDLSHEDVKGLDRAEGRTTRGAISLGLVARLRRASRSVRERANESWLFLIGATGSHSLVLAPIGRPPQAAARPRPSWPFMPFILHCEVLRQPSDAGKTVTICPARRAPGSRA